MSAASEKVKAFMDKYIDFQSTQGKKPSVIHLQKSQHQACLDAKRKVAAERYTNLDPKKVTFTKYRNIPIEVVPDYK